MGLQFLNGKVYRSQNPGIGREREQCGGERCVLYCGDDSTIGLH